MLEKDFLELVTLKNPQRWLLLPENRDLYDKLFERYKEIYFQGQPGKIDPSINYINDKFIDTLFEKKR